MSIGTEAYYRIIAEDLRRDISRGVLAPGDMMASENALAERYATSRITVRKGLGLLEQEGLVHSLQGKGYFVNKPAHDDYKLVFSDEEPGFETSYKGISAKRPTDEVRKVLELAERQMVIEIVRIIKKDGEPVALDYKYIPHEKGAPTLESAINYAVFPEIAAAKLSAFAFKTDLRISAVLPPDHVCKLLGCECDAPLLAIKRLIVGSRGERVGYGVRYQLAECGELHATSGYDFSTGPV